VAGNSADPFHTSVYDLSWIHFWRISCLEGSGRIAEACELAGVHYEDAVGRGDHNASVALGQMFCLSLLARGRTEQVERVLEEIRARLRTDEVTVQDMFWLYARLWSGVYAGTAREIWTTTAEYRARYFASWQGRSVATSAMRILCGGVAATAANASTDVAERLALRREAGRWAKSGSRPGNAFQKVLRDALLACLDGDRARAIAALRHRISDAGSLRNAQVLKRRLGELLRSDEGATLIVEADAFLRQGGVVDPARYAAMLTPGIELP
jgi:hypothetical protein